MRAATVIVGAIAVSSCLIALALVLSGGEESAAPGTQQPSRGDAQARAESDAATAAALNPCSVEVTVEGASCELGKGLLAAYDSAGGKAGTVVTIDPDSGDEVSFDCTGTAPTICTGAEGVTIYLAR